MTHLGGACSAGCLLLAKSPLDFPYRRGFAPRVVQFTLKPVDFLDGMFQRSLKLFPLDIAESDTAHLLGTLDLQTRHFAAQLISDVYVPRRCSGHLPLQIKEPLVQSIEFSEPPG